MEPPTNEDISHLTNTNLLFVGLLVLDVVLMFYPTEMMSPNYLYFQVATVPPHRFDSTCWSWLVSAVRSGQMPQRGFRRLVDVAEKWDGQAALTLIAGGDFLKWSTMWWAETIPYHTIPYIFYSTLYGGDEHPLLVETLFLGSPGYRVQQYHDSSPSQQRTAGALQTAGPKPRMGKSWHATEFGLDPTMPSELL